MSEIQGAWVPHSAEEDELLMDLHEATRKAHNNGVDVEDIVGGMNYLAAAISVHGADSGFVRSADDAVTEPAEPAKRETCPTCEGPISSVRGMMGGEVEVHPCGCNATIHQVPGWVDIPGDD